MTMSARSSTLLDSLTGDEEIGGFFTKEAELFAMLQVEESLAIAEAEVGLIDKEALRAVAKTCRTFKPDWERLARGLAQDGVVVPEFVKQLRVGVGEPHAKAVHLGATSQDVIDTALILRLKGAVAVYLRRLDGLLQDLHALKARDGAVRLMAHTRMQQALPFTAADKIDTWLQPLERHREALEALAPRLLAIQLGGPVGTRAELKGHGDAVADLMAERLGLAYAPQWHSQRDRIGEFGSWLSLLSGTLGKVGQDVALMAQNEVGEVRLATGGGSSAMPHKSNPVPAEVLVTLARFNAGLLGILHQALVHENERSGAAWTLEWLALPQMAVATGAGLRLAQDLVGKLTFQASAK